MACGSSLLTVPTHSSSQKLYIDENLPSLLPTACRDAVYARCTVRVRSSLVGEACAKWDLFALGLSTVLLWFIGGRL